MRKSFACFRARLVDFVNRIKDRSDAKVVSKEIPQLAYGRLATQFRRDLFAARPVTVGLGRTSSTLICQSGRRASNAAEILQTTSLSSIALLDGGIAAWEAAGKPYKRGKQKWSLERQVRGVAGTLVLLGALGGLFAWKPLTWISALIGGGLAYSAASNTCGMALLLSKLPYNQGAVCNVRETLNNMEQAAQ